MTEHDVIPLSIIRYAELHPDLGSAGSAGHKEQRLQLATTSPHFISLHFTSPLLPPPQAMLESHSARLVFSAIMTAAVLAVQSVLQWLLLSDDDDDNPRGRVDTESEDYRRFIAAEMQRLHMVQPAPALAPAPAPAPAPNRQNLAIKQESSSPARLFRRRMPSPSPTPQHPVRVKQEKYSSSPSPAPPRWPTPRLVPRPGDFVLRLRPSHVILHNTADAADLWDGPFEVASTTLQHWVELRLPAGSRTPAWTPVENTMPAPHECVGAVGGEAENGMYVVAKVRAVRGSVNGCRSVLVHWRGWGSEDDTWEPEKAVPRAFVREYEKRARRWEDAGLKR